jgi:hypothetical protein
MLFLLSCTLSTPSPHAMFMEFAQTNQLPAPEQIDPSISIIYFSKNKTLSLQERYDDIELMLHNGLSLEQASSVDAASLTITQLLLINNELATSKVQLNPETSDIIFSHLLDAETLTKALLKKRILQLIQEEKQVRSRIKSALQ